MKTRLVFLFICFCSFSYSQNNRLWATYHGGTLEDNGRSIITDDSGNVYLSGYTESTSGISSGGFQNTYGGGSHDAFLAKFDSLGNRLWATYYGGTGDDYGLCVTTDNLNNVYLSGQTSSNNGIASGGFQNTYGNNTDAFLVKFNSSGSRIWATYYGGIGSDYGTMISTDSSANVYLTGNTNSISNIASGGFQNFYVGGRDALLVKFDSNGNRIWATYYGGSDDDYGNCITSDVSGNLYLSGYTSSNIGIASGGFQNTYGGGTLFGDAYLVKFDSLGNRLWATYYGGTEDDLNWGVSSDVSGNVYLSGYTESASGIAAGGFQNAFGGGTYDGFLVKFNSSGSRIWATYYGGADNDYGDIVISDNSGNVYLSGQTSSTTGIASGGFQNTFGGLSDAYVVRFDSSGNRISATYYGGTGDEEGLGLITDKFGYVYLAGFTTSTTSISDGGFQNSYAGGVRDAFLVKFQDTIACSLLTFSNSIITDVTCNGGTDGSIILNLNGGTPPYSFNWSNGDSLQNLSAIAVGVYSVTVSDVNGCTGIASEIISEPLVIEINAVVINTICKNSNGSINLETNGGTPPYYYLWNTSVTTEDLINISSGTYNVTISDSNECVTNYEITVTNSDDSCLIIPSVFTPNDDGTNDYWQISGLNMYPESLTVKVFNRWGQLLFSSKGYSVPWDGTYKGSNLPTADYYFIIDLSNGAESLTGTVTIKR